MNEVYTKLKFLRFHEQLNALEDNQLIAPVHIRLKPINACDHDCWYCAYHDPNLQLGENMQMKDRLSREKLLEIVDDAAEMGVKAVTFSGGGEPLIHPNIVEAVNKLGEHKLQVATLSNGSHLHKDVAEAFARYGTWVRISIDGYDPASYAKQRNVKVSEFDKIIGNMRKFAEMRSDCVLGVNFIVDKKNYNNIFQFACLMKDIGVNHLKIMGVLISNDGKECNSYHEEISSQVKDQIDACRKLETEGFSIVDHYHEFPERFDKEYTSCPSIQFLVVIGADAKVYSCHDKAYTDLGTLGSIKDRSFKDFWFSEENIRRVREINPSTMCLHHCAEHRRNLLLHEYLNVDSDHIAFV